MVLRVNSPLITAGPGLVKFSDGTLLAVCPVDGYRKGGENANNTNYAIHLAVSRDAGRSWREAAPSLPYMTATPFLVDDTIYLLAHRRGRRDVLILESEDQGATWSEPVELYRGPYWNAPTGVAVHNGVLYRAVGTGGHGARIETVVLALDLKQNPMSPQSWRKSNPVKYPGTPKALDRNLYPGGSGRSVFALDHWLEPNINNVRGRLMVTHRTRIDGYATAGLTAICDLNDSGEEMKLNFTQFYPMPGAQNKFFIIYDKKSDLFWMPVNIPTDNQNSTGWDKELWGRGFLGGPGNERRILMLQYSRDCLNWFHAGCIAAWPSPMHSFSYAATLVDGDDLLILSRTCAPGEDTTRNNHDTNLVTFHRVRNFRSLALVLKPDFSPNAAEAERPQIPAVPPRSDGRVLHVDFEKYTDGVVQALNAGVRWLGDPFSGRKEGDVAITKANAWSGMRAARVVTRESDEIGRVRLQARYDAPKIDGDSVNEFVFRGNGTTMDDFVLWSATSADGRRAGVTLLAVAGDKHDTFAIDVIQAESPGSHNTKRTRGVVPAVDDGEWIRAILHRLRGERMVELWIGRPGKEQRIGKFNDLNSGAAAERIELGDTSTKTIRGGGDWDDVLVGGRLADGVEPAKAEPPLRNVSDEVAGIVTPIQLGRSKQLFLDDVVIDSKKGLRREMHAVRKHGGNPLVTPDSPWEGRSVLLYGGVVRDPDTKKFRMWYLAWGKHIGQPSFICCAESSDGIRWEKSELNLVEYKGSKANNIVLPGWSQTSVLRDPTDPDPARRYKALLRYKGLRGFTSPDGVHWKDVGPLIDQGFDSTTLHWDPVNKQWVAMVKIFKDGKRARGYATSKDFLNWTDTYFMSTVDGRDGSGDQMYSMSMFHYETVYLGLLRMYHTDSDVVDIQLATSRNSKRWERPTRNPFIPTGSAKGTWDFGNNSVPATPPIRVGDELWFYYAGRSTLHNEIPNDGAIGLATLRVDGFASMTADDQGTLTTKPLHCRGGQLCLNADASQGSIRVELLTDDGVVSSKPIQGDAVRHAVTWDTTKPIPRGDIRLRFHVDRAKLYSFWTE
ncbi:MAG: exo-alpha-sialidase [Planctomycetes bacterium]|nr:exo-alpha-sialidase [Planctomycetota bacterium]